MNTPKTKGERDWRDGPRDRDGEIERINKRLDDIDGWTRREAHDIDGWTRREAHFGTNTRKLVRDLEARVDELIKSSGSKEPSDIGLEERLDRIDHVLQLLLDRS